MRRAEPLIRQAAAGGAKIVCTTECFLDGYAIADKTIPLENYRGPWANRFPTARTSTNSRPWPTELKIHLVAGMLEADGELRLNTAVWSGPDGKLIGKYRKQKLQHELVRNTAGNQSPVFDTPSAKSA